MINFLVIFGMILWGVLTVALIIGVIFMFVDQEPVAGLIGIVLFAASLAGIGITTDANGWFGDALPPDGCYQITHDTDYIPMQTGKVITPVLVDDTSFIPINCP